MINACLDGHWHTEVEVFNVKFNVVLQVKQLIEVFEHVKQLLEHPNIMKLIVITLTSWHTGIKVTFAAEAFIWKEFSKEV